MKPLFPFLLLLCATASAQVPGKSAYVLGAEQNFISSSCKFEFECDCCEVILVLLTAREFAMIDRCEDGDSYYMGTYTIANPKLTLTFKQAIVNAAVEVATNTTTYELNSFEFVPEVFNMVPCGETVKLENTGEQFFKFGILLGAEEEKRVREELKESKGYKMLVEAKI